MKWRTPLAVVMGLLLPMPLLLLLGGALGWSGWAQVPPDEQLSPMLSSQQQQQLLTFGRPCQDSSPEGFYCDTGPNGASCLPTCEGRTCPQGQECARFESGPSSCAVIRGRNCQRTPCPDGAQCRTTYSPQRPGEVKMECVVPCGEKTPACPEGILCHNGTCRQPCEPSELDACASGQECVYHPIEKRWLCQLG